MKKEKEKKKKNMFYMERRRRLRCSIISALTAQLLRYISPLCLSQYGPRKYLKIFFRCSIFQKYPVFRRMNDVFSKNFTF